MLKSNFLKFSLGGLQEIAWQSQLDSNAWLGVMFKIITTLNTLSFSYITWKMLHACRTWSPWAIHLQMLCFCLPWSHYGKDRISMESCSCQTADKVKLDTSGSNSPPHPGKGQIFGHSPGITDSRMPLGFPRGRGTLKFWITGTFSPSNCWYK